MPINKGERFDHEDIYIDYNFEKVMLRWDHLKRKRYKKFYGESEGNELVPHNNRLYNDALLYGDEITLEEYMKGKELADR
ncbi:MAG: hypothetical protein L3J59_00610 [Methylococcaceae bacterium]|nr:hypothetical protein [Methylococcaceae bacterium]